jgi:arylsulfatase A-like enzyme
MLGLLRQKGLYDDTLIVYTADHGEFMGFHHMLLKGNYMYDPLVKVPLIVKWPGGERAGAVSQRMVGNIDLAPTLCRAAGCQVAAQMHGRALQDPGNGHDLIFAEADGGRQVMVRSGERKLILSDSRSKNLFFDLQRDPMEMNNLYASPAYSDEVRTMTVAASAWRDKNPNPSAYQDFDAPQIQQPNVPPHDLSHCSAIIQYYREKMLALQNRNGDA